MKHQVFSEELVAQVVSELNIANLGQATIGEILLVASTLEKKTGIPFIRMDQGSPGLPANKVGIEAEKAALDRGVGSQYPAADGIRYICTLMHTYYRFSGRFFRLFHCNYTENRG